MYRLMMVKFDRDSGNFDDAEFNKFCKENSIVRIDKEFVNSAGEIYYSFFIEYVSRRPGFSKPDMENLTDIEIEQYNRIRDWRNDLAAKEGMPAYIIMYNAQIYETVKKQPKSKADFAMIKGMKQKGEKYGEEIIKMLQEAEVADEG